ncbi:MULTISPECIES: HPr family phosphocarrier protein [Idiomarina]|jgi:phosphotransferase system HPr (HPr) family protein|uniref:HPr family phosphocarrier protein n=2 Tax=Idiomarina baltica TaxID=190892 RepID=A0A348WNJ4_9GAMM|nr:MULTISPECIES: HPr family phosphocarrier protein [Idiomarina]MBL74201.1 HPr family phosphocarrier protein [Idiomarinaceae bacterium]MEC8925366.1 HPr family phosphocarrier protein [Pseudomonadota bacterium]EAQ31104.1 Phosphotransferase system, HPr-related protein NPr [Idiomarina baltica OS145]KXS36574.1 MAG: phosphotransferase system, HPr-related protein NPr [Idiomarina sp. T82-3]HAE89925.1 HPr family phosphocarrier protein [Idiomarina sp.]|tara:strand:+ start:1504 stop:1782 length:279 start_codon:yes stop_codon:yes gene_type:complete
MTQKVCKSLIIRNKLGLHARAATKLARLTQTFAAKITISQDGQEVDAGSVMCLMLLASQQGREVQVCADGDDAEAALVAITTLFEDKFEEAE